MHAVPLASGAQLVASVHARHGVRLFESVSAEPGGQTSDAHEPTEPIGACDPGGHAMQGVAGFLHTVRTEELIGTSQG